MKGYNENVYPPRHLPHAEDISVPDFAASTQEPTPEDVEQQIQLAREEYKQLRTQINRIKSKIQDADLQSLSKNVAPLSSINLKPVTTLKGHNNKVSSFRWSSDSKTILSASQDGFMLLWDAATGLKRNAIPLHSQWVLSCAMCPNGNLVASAGLDNNCTIYRVSRKDRIQQNIVSIFKGHTCYISEIEFLDDNAILTASGDMTCALWDITKSKRINEYADHLGDVLSLSVAPLETEGGGNIFASGGSDGYLYIWDKRASTSVQSFFVGDSDVSKVKFFRNGNTIATGSDDGWTNLYDLRSDCRIAHYSLSRSLHDATSGQQQAYITSKMEYTAPPNTLARASSYSPAARTVASSFIDNQGVISIDFSRSGRLMYVSYTEFGCAVWDLIKGEIIGKLDGHSDRISGVATSPDGLAICTGSWDTTMKVWSPAYM
ncbi:AaceriACR097Wp [[Ashbya] aceris (nom. inval.)]|nr:AaceriACR097Wp [[Ashbya] aceris (nom. inval.)]